jgi:O-antigen/teichoic acid export membrane protein
VASSSEIQAPGVRRTAIASFTSYAIPVLISLVAMPIVFRLVGPAKFGILSIAFLSPALALSLDLGTTSAAVRRLALELEERKSTLGTALGTYAAALIVVGAVLGALVAVAAPQLVAWLGLSAEIGAESARDLVRLCAAWMGMSLALSLPAIVLRARQRFRELTIVQSSLTLALWGAAIALAASGGELWSIVLAAVLITVSSSIACLVLARRDLCSPRDLGVDLGMLRNDGRFSAGLFLVQLSNLIAFQLDRVVVAALASPAAAGVYALCVGIANKILFSVAALTSFAYPRVAAMRGIDRQAEIGAFLQALSRVGLVLVAPVVLPAVILAQPFLQLWLGSATPESVRLIQLLVAGYAIAAVCAPATHVITGSGTSRLAALFAWVTAILLLSGMYLFVPSLGLPGAGVANVIAMSSALVFLALVRRQFPPPHDASLSRVLIGIAGGCMAQLAFLLALHPLVESWPMLIVASLGSLAVYQIVRWATKSMAIEEERLLHSIAAKLR